MTENHLVTLIVRHLGGLLTKDEETELSNWANLSEVNRQLLIRINNEDQLKKELHQWKSIDPEKGYVHWVYSRQVRRKFRTFRLVGLTAAASLVGMIALIGIRREVVQKEGLSSSATKTNAIVSPGRNTALLTLANGQQVLLDSVNARNLPVQKGIKIDKIDSSSLSYSLPRLGKEEELAYNTLTTPRSGQYQVQLSDGSRVWLNNVSSLRYPVVFGGNERMVELSGEAYFEIANDVNRPFIVKAVGHEVRVLGTNFNIKAYADEDVTATTLLTGAVQVKAGGETVRLHPDEQAQWNGTGKLLVMKDVPSRDIVSWKNGFFYFGRASLQEVMRQLARWYDIDVKYEGRVPHQEFGGRIDRNLPLNELLKFLDKSQIHFRLEGRTLVVLSF
jgi:transmembrane sensor